MRFLFVLSFLAVTIFGAMPVQAQDDQNVRVAIVDVIKLQNTSKAAEDIKSQVKKLRENYKEEFEAKEKELQKQQKDLLTRRESISEDEFRKQAQEFQKKIVEESQKLQERQKELDKAVGEALEELRGEIIKVVDDVSNAGAFTLVLPKQSVFYFAKDMEITDEVMKKLNKQVKRIKIKAK